MLQRSKRPAIIIASSAVVVLIILFVLLILSSMNSGGQYSVSLEMWGPIDDSDAFGGTLNVYRETNPFIEGVEYKKLLVDEYKEDILNALAAGNGPDLFLIRNSWMPEFVDKIEPAPEAIMNETMLRQTFVDVVADDVLVDGSIYGLPLSVDSLALYYNKDIFNFESVTRPPETWDEFVSTTQKLTQIDEQGAIVRSGASLGTAENINRSTDIFNALLLQYGTGLEHTSREGGGQGIRLGNEAQEALDFYMQFSDIDSAAYSWNITEDYSIDAFQESELAMMLNYSWHYDTIKRKNSRLNIGIAPLPQLAGSPPINYPNYWVWVVAKNKDVSDSSNPQMASYARKFESWQFLRYLTMYRGGEIVLMNAVTGNEKAFEIPGDPAEKYLEMTGSPAARRDLIEKQKSDPILGPFATGNLLARSWRQGDSEEAERIMASIIDQVYRGQLSSREAVRLLEERIRTLSRR